MGSMPRLKIKDEIRYRKGSTNESVNCKHCQNFNPLLGSEVNSRCVLIGGLLKESRRYNVRADHTCDRQQKSEAYKRHIEEIFGRRT